MLLHFQNISLFLIASCSLFSCLYYNLYSQWNENKEQKAVLFDTLMPFVGTHAVIDFFLTKTFDLKLHHICIFGVIFYNNYYNVSPEYRLIFIYPLLKTEISSIFYVLKYYLPKNTFFYNLNLAIFYLLFIKYRIIDFYNEIIYKNNSFNIVFDKYSKNNYYLSSILLASCYGLFILNLYWFLLINKILYKIIVKSIKIDSDIICHHLCSYIHWINVPLSIYIYKSVQEVKNCFDVIGIITLSVTSFIYHNDVYKKLQNNEITDYTIPDKKNIIYFLNDILCIQLRSFLAVFSNYYNSPFLVSTAYISVMFHVVSIYYCITNIFELLIDFEKNKDIFLFFHNIIVAIPIICDVLFIFANSTNEIGIPFLLINIVIAMVMTLNPLNKLTHVLFHLCLIIQNYYICLSSSK